MIETRAIRGCKTSLHVLILPSWYPTDLSPVAGVFFRDQILALKSHGLTTGVLYPDLRMPRTVSLGGVAKHRFQVTEQDEAGVPTLRSHGWSVPKSRRLTYRLWVHQARRLMRRYVQTHGMPDLIHAHSAGPGGIAARSLASEYDLRYVVTEHSSSYARGLTLPWQDAEVRAVFRDAAEVIAVSRSLAETLQPYVGKREVLDVPNVVDTGYFHRPATPRRSSPFRFLAVALLTANKGLDVLLRSFAEAFDETDDVLLEIGGDGEQRQALEQLATDLGVRSKVRFLGMLSREQVREAMWRANTFVLPSFIETFGVVFVEAMATGLPVIATRCGGPEEFVTEEVGWLSDVGDTAQLASLMKTARMSYLGRARLESKIRAYAESRFSEDVVAARLISLYREVAERA